MKKTKMYSALAPLASIMRVTQALGGWKPTLFFVFFVFFAYCAAEDVLRISGEQDGYYDAGEYLVTKDVIIGADKTLTFAPGTVVRCMPYAGITVRGRLECGGKADAPVVFTSAADTIGAGANPPPSGWNGIAVDSGALDFSHVTIAHSVYGIRAKTSPASIVIRDAFFRSNGIGDFTLNDSMIIIDTDTSFSFPPACEKSDPRTDTLAIAQQAIAGEITANETMPAAPLAPPNPRRVKAKIISSAIGLSCFVVSAIGARTSNVYYRRYHSETDMHDPAASQRVADYRKASRAWGAVAVIGGVAGVCGLGVTLLF